jgi:hypothetical protein
MFIETPVLKAMPRDFDDCLASRVLLDEVDRKEKQ